MEKAKGQWLKEAGASASRSKAVQGALKRPAAVSSKPVIDVAGAPDGPAGDSGDEEEEEEEECDEGSEEEEEAAEAPQPAAKKAKVATPEVRQPGRQKTPRQGVIRSSVFDMF